MKNPPNQSLFEAIDRIFGCPPTQGEMDEIIQAIQEDEELLITK